MSDPIQPAAAAPPIKGLLRRALVVDVILPLIAVLVLTRSLLVPTIPAFAFAALFPALSILTTWLTQKRVEWIGLVVVASLACGIALAFLTGEAGFGALRVAPVFALFGIANLISARGTKPLMFFVARIFETQGDSAKIASWNARLQAPRFLGAMRRLSLVWGSVCLMEALLGTLAAFTLPPHVVFIAEPVLALTTIAGLLAWTYARRLRAEASNIAGI